MTIPRAAACAALLAALTVAGCREKQPAPTVVRLADHYTEATLSGTAPSAPAAARTEWRFDAAAPAGAEAQRGWTALQGVTGLGVRDGALAGTSSDDFPMLAVDRHADKEDQDVVHAIEVRASVDAGTTMSLAAVEEEKVDAAQLKAIAANFGWRTRAPLVADGTLRTYTLKPLFPVVASTLKHLVLRPTDAKGAHFAVASVRVLFRREHLASVASGVGWEGLSEIYRETLVSRAPEVLAFKLRVPALPRFDLAIGTPEDEPVRFRVAVRSTHAPEVTLLTRTVTRPHHWEDVTLDLGPWAGREVTLALSLESAQSGTIGFWGAPTVRERNAVPPPTTHAAAAEPPLGVILVWADTLRRDHLGAYGYARPTSPVIDRLAREGVLFKDCIGQGSWTKVATPSLLTSLYPTSHGVKEFTDRIPASATTLAEAYRAAGYTTLSFSSILFTGRFTNLHQGFDVVHEDGSLPDHESSKTSREYVDRLLAWVDTHRDVPFFTFLHVSDPHDPYRPHPPYDTLFADPPQAEEHERQNKEVRKVVTDPLLKRFGFPTRAELVQAHLDPDAYTAYDRDWYDGAIREMDTEMGRLVEGLANAGLERKVLLVFAGDHGEEFLDHGRSFHGQSVYGEMNDVPLVLWRPGVLPAGRVVDATVRTIDVMPTLLEMSGIAVPPAAQGQSLLPFLQAEGPGTVRAAGNGDRSAVSEKAVTTDVGAPPPRETASVALIAGGQKLIHNLQRPAGKPEYELYDHRADPLDSHDLAASKPDVAARLQRELASWKARAESERVKPDDDAAKSLSPEQLERLRALGYIQ
jgi:arylsulfatase